MYYSGLKCELCCPGLWADIRLARVYEIEGHSGAEKATERVQDAVTWEGTEVRVSMKI